MSDNYCPHIDLTEGVCDACTHDRHPSSISLNIGAKHINLCNKALFDLKDKIDAYIADNHLEREDYHGRENSRRA